MPRAFSVVNEEYEKWKEAAQTYIRILKDPYSTDAQKSVAMMGAVAADDNLLRLEQQLRDIRNAPSSISADVTPKTMSQLPNKDKYIELVDRFDETTNEYGYKELIENFRALSPNIYPDAPKMADECESKYLEAKKRRESEEAERDAIEKEQKRIAAQEAATEKGRYVRKRVANNIGTVLQLGIVAVYLYMLFTTELVRRFYVHNQPNYNADLEVWSSWMWPGFLYVSLPLGVCAVAIGIISVLLLRKSYRSSGKAMIFITGFVHSITLGFWYTKGELKGSVFLAIAMCVCSAIVSFPGVLLAKTEN